MNSPRIQTPADVLLTVIQRLNQNPYSLTKSECIAEVKKMRDQALAAADAQPDHIPDAGKMVARQAMTEQQAGLLNQAHDMLLAHADEQRKRGNDSAAAGAECSASAVLELAAAWAAAQPVAVPQGFALVPVMPTQAMAKAGCYRYCDQFVRDYRAMLAAAPAAPATAAQHATIWQWLTSDGNRIGERWQAINARWDGENGRAGLEAAAAAAMRADQRGSL
jgi:hypothetical protein